MRTLEKRRAAKVSGKPRLHWHFGIRLLHWLTVAALAAQPEYARLTIFDVDFDTQKDALRVLKIQTQSTLAVFKAKAEVSRAVGITQGDAIQAGMKQVL